MEIEYCLFLIGQQKTALWRQILDRITYCATSELKAQIAASSDDI
jgi:hypothetical protein